ncbi:MAG: NUDIX hydrolase [Oscillospiraceae bacterium]
MKLQEDTLCSKERFKGRIFTVTEDEVRLPNGAEAKREVVSHNGGVCVAALDENDCLFFVRQFRYPYKQVLLELPAGKLEKGEDPFEAVKREQREETGTLGEKYEFLGDLYPSPGYCGEIIRLWACRVTEYCAMDLDEDEFVEVKKIPIAEAVRMVLANEIPDSKTQVAILKTASLLEKGVL